MSQPGYGTTTANTSSAPFYSKYREGMPVLPKAIAIIILIVNIFFPGIGTMVLSCASGRFLMDQLIIGILQLITAACIIGWVWSIIWGVWVVLKSE